MSSTDGVFGHQVVTGLRAAKEGIAYAVTAPVWQCADADVEDAIELLDAVEAMATAMRSSLLVQAEERSLRERTGAPSTGGWLVERFEPPRVQWRAGSPICRVAEGLVVR